MDKKIDEKVDKKQEAFLNEIDALVIVGFTRLKLGGVIIYFTRKAYGKVLNGWSKYSDTVKAKPTIKDLKDLMKSKGGISY